MRRGLMIAAFVLLALLDVMFAGQFLYVLALTTLGSGLPGIRGNSGVFIAITFFLLALSSGLIWLTVAVAKRVAN